MWRYLLLMTAPLLCIAEEAGGGLAFSEQLVITEEAAVEAAKAANTGRVLDIAFDEQRKPAVYKVKMLSDDGVVRTVVIDAETGKSVER